MPPDPETPAPCPELPPSATPPAVAAGMLLAFWAGTILLWWRQPYAGIVPAATGLMAMTAFGAFAPELLWHKIRHRSDATPTHRLPQGSWARTGTKFAGLLGSLGLVALLYWLFPEYASGSAFYGNYWTLLRLILPVWLALAVPYLYWVDARMEQPQDNLWQLGRMVTGRWAGTNVRAAGQQLLGWLIKGFFLPLMFTYLCRDLGRFLHFDLKALGSFKGLYDFLYDFLFFTDVGLVSMTYLLSLRAMDTHIRSSEPTMLGWVAALVCYDPFWGLIGGQYLRYQGGLVWGDWLRGIPVLPIWWGGCILLLVGIYVWATVAFGGRFSNLTHRGIITGGPYRFTKHPAYWAKNLSWWMISVPFVVTDSVWAALRHCLLLLLLNGIYFLRAKTEERHLALDPIYRRYAQWIDRHGLLRGLNRLPLVGRLARWQLPPLDPAVIGK